jgi:hypothetical protein
MGEALHEFFDPSNQLANASEAATANGLLSNPHYSTPAQISVDAVCVERICRSKWKTTAGDLSC